MEAQENPVSMLKRSEHKTIRELEAKVLSKQSEIRGLWKLKAKEKKNWKKGLPGEEVGWCKRHENFCDIDSDCKPLGHYHTGPSAERVPEGKLKDNESICHIWT